MQCFLASVVNFVLRSILPQLSPSVDGPIQAASELDKSGFHHPDNKGMFSPDPNSSSGSSRSPTPLSSGARVSPIRRLSGPEKIINLHEQLQKTLLSSYQVLDTKAF